jgi:hypothetical protein
MENQDVIEMSTTLDGKVQPTENNVPDLVKIGQIPSNLVMDYDTTVYEPVVKSQSFVRFQIDNKGILHSNSKLTLSMGDGVNASDFFPVGVGVNSLISRATLKSGGQTLSEIDDWNYYMGYKSMFIQSENNKQRESVTTSRLMNFKNTYNVSGVSPTSASSASAIPEEDGYGIIENTKASAIGLDVGKTCFAITSDDNCSTLLPIYLHGNKKSEFQINLSDLFPMLKMNQIPLYMLRDPLFIELALTPRATGERMSSRLNSTAGKDIDLNNIHMIIDHIYYPAEQMEQYAAANPQITLSYMDYRLSKQSLTPAQAQNNIRNVGGAGRIISKVIHSIGAAPDSTDSSNNRNRLLNLYESQYPNTSNKTFDVNVYYNNDFLYPIDLNNSARAYNLVGLSEGVSPYVPRDVYNLEGGIITGDENIMDLSQSTDLSGKLFWTAHRLNRGERVSGKGIEVHTKYDTLDTGSWIQRVWLEYTKIATITNGVVNVYNA